PSEGECGTVDGSDDMVVNDAQGLTEFGYCRGMIDGEQRSEQTAVDLGVEDGHPNPVWCQHVCVGARLPSDQTFASEAPEGVGHLRRGVAGGDQRGTRG